MLLPPRQGAAGLVVYAQAYVGGGQIDGGAAAGEEETAFLGNLQLGAGAQRQQVAGIGHQLKFVAELQAQAQGGLQGVGLGLQAQAQAVGPQVGAGHAQAIVGVGEGAQLAAHRLAGVSQPNPAVQRPVARPEVVLVAQAARPAIAAELPVHALRGQSHGQLAG